MYSYDRTAKRTTSDRLKDWHEEFIPTAAKQLKSLQGTVTEAAMFFETLKTQAKSEGVDVPADLERAYQKVMAVEKAVDKLKI